MDQERLQYVFGADVEHAIDLYDLEHESGRIEAVEHFLALPADTPQRAALMIIRCIAVNQILDDDPPESWLTVQRLRTTDLDLEEVLAQLSTVIGESVSMAMDGEMFDAEAFVDALATLPLPTVPEIARRLIDLARAQPGILVDDHVEAVVADFPTDSQTTGESLVGSVLDTLIEGPLCWLPGDATVYVPDLVDGRTFLHRPSDIEIELGVLSAGFDLGAFARFDNVRLADGSEIEQFSVESGHLALRGDDGWLTAFEPGSLLAVTVEVDAPDGGVLEPVDAVVTIDVVDDEPPLDDAVVDAVWAGYEQLVDETGLPVSGDQLAIWLLFHHPDLFDRPQRPLSDLCAAAGLEQRGGHVAHDESIWRRELHHRRFHMLLDMVPEVEWRHVLSNAMDALDDPDATADHVRAALDACAEPETLDVLTDIFFPHDLDLADEFERDRSDSPGRLFDLVNRAITVARRPREVATAEYLACALYERCGAVEIAEEHLRRAGDARPRLGPVVERLGWYRFDRGDARGAMNWWRELTELPGAAATIEPFLARSAGTSKLGRNDPCWCGSGRKFKQCHLNTAEVPALPDRVGWLCRKASLWLEHAAGDVREIVTSMATARAVGDTDPDLAALESLDRNEFEQLFTEALDDPIIFDAALNEGGLFSMFLRERGALLPDDERLLAMSWHGIERSVYEVVGVDRGVGMTLRDLATGDVVDVREHTASRDTLVGERYCARVVPDGETHQMIGGVFPVRTGHEAAVLDLCETGDGLALCAWVGRLNRMPPLIHTLGLADEMFD